MGKMANVNTRNGVVVQNSERRPSYIAAELERKQTR